MSSRAASVTRVPLTSSEISSLCRFSTVSPSSVIAVLRAEQLDFRDGWGLACLLLGRAYCRTGNDSGCRFYQIRSHPLGSATTEIVVGNAS